MTVQGNRASKRALVVIVALLILVLVLFDLSLSDSFLRSAWNELFGGNSGRTFMQRMFRE